MDMVANFLVAFVALLHLIFLVLEMFLWQTPFGKKLFGMSKEKALMTAVLAKNQGLYNGFLAAGLIWTFFIPDTHFQYQLRIFLLICIIIAAIYGGITAKGSILLIQGLPALLALIAVLRLITLS